MQDCLAPGHPVRKAVIAYLHALRLEYLNTQNYFEAFLKMELPD